MDCIVPNRPLQAANCPTELYFTISDAWKHCRAFGCPKLITKANPPSPMCPSPSRPGLGQPSTQAKPTDLMALGKPMRSIPNEEGGMDLAKAWHDESSPLKSQTSLFLNFV